MSQYRPDPRYLELGEGFADPVRPARFPERVLRFRNDAWAARVGLDDLDDEAWVKHFALFEPLPDNLPAPLATRYHGHQFRSYNPDLGDGRGFLFAQLRDDRDRLLDLGTKGSGKTPYSRGGDGRLTLKGGVREILATELLEARGVYTSKTFSLIETGEKLQRNDEPSPTRSCVLVRLGHSHVRFGTFQRHAFHDDVARIRKLTEHCLDCYYPDVAEKDVPLALFRQVVPRSARLAASWMAAGFVHGVLNTDNMNVTGESFDYGPWRFLAHYDPAFTAAYFDHSGLYAYGRQVQSVAWNLARFAGALRPASPNADWEGALTDFEHHVKREVPRQFLRRLGLKPSDDDTNAQTLEALLVFLYESKAPFEQFFHDWYGGALSETRARESPHASHYAKMAALREAFERHEPADASRLEHPVMQRPYPVDMRIEEVEAIWARIDRHDDWRALGAKVADIRASA